MSEEEYTVVADFLLALDELLDFTRNDGPAEIRTRELFKLMDNYRR